MTKHEFLAFSLPYGLRYIYLNGTFGLFDSNCYEKALKFNANYRIILRPLSDLTKDQDKEDSLFWRLEEFACNARDAASMYDHSGLNDINWIQEPFEIVMWLIKEHFDIAGLIDKGEAIDVNTLPENPYK